MSNRTDWKQVVHEVMQAYVVSDRNRPVPLNRDCTMSFSQRLEAELHNAFMAGQEAVPVISSEQLRASLQKITDVVEGKNDFEGDDPRTAAGMAGATPVVPPADRTCPLCGRDSMDHRGVCDACGADLGGVNMDLIRAARARIKPRVSYPGVYVEELPLPPQSEVVWENECQLVFHDSHGPSAEMGLCYQCDDPEIGDREVQVHITETGKPVLFPKIKGVPVRITISRVPGGNV